MTPQSSLTDRMHSPPPPPPLPVHLLPAWNIRWMSSIKCLMQRGRRMREGSIFSCCKMRVHLMRAAWSYSLPIQSRHPWMRWFWERWGKSYPCSEPCFGSCSDRGRKYEATVCRSCHGVLRQWARKCHASTICHASCRVLAGSGGL